jgi:hypothetical protein
VQVLAGYLDAHFWLLHVAGLERKIIASRTDRAPFFDRVFITAATGAITLAAASKDREPKLVPAALRGMREAVALAGCVSAWGDGGVIALRYAELVEWAALQPQQVRLITLEAAVASEDWVWRIVCCIGSLAGPIHLTRAFLVIGRAVAILGGIPMSGEAREELTYRCLRGDPDGEPSPYICPVPTRDPVVVEGLPFAEWYKQDTRPTQCYADGCQQQGGAEMMKTCARCKMASYCSAACQKTHWKSVHKRCCYSRAYTPPTTTAAVPGKEGDPSQPVGESEGGGSGAESEGGAAPAPAAHAIPPEAAPNVTEPP